MLKKFKTYQLAIAALFFVFVSYAFTHVLAVFTDCGYGSIENETCTVSYSGVDILSGMSIAFLICVLILGLLHDASKETKKVMVSKTATVKAAAKKTTAVKAKPKTTATKKKTAVKKTK